MRPFADKFREELLKGGAHMETRDVLAGEESGPIPGAEQSTAGIKASTDRFEMKVKMERAEEEIVEAAAVLYEKAVRQRMPAAPPEPQEQVDFEELEAISQELKLRQLCQDIAAQIMVDGQDFLDGADEAEE